MEVKYPKEYIKTDGRRLRLGGPRDLQQQQKMEQSVGSTDIIIEELKKQIGSLRSELKGGKPDGYFTAEEVDEEIRKAVKQALGSVELQKKNNYLKDKVKKLEEDNEDISAFKKEINTLKRIIANKEELIEVLKTKPAIIDGVTIGVERPQMEQKFIDPLEKGAGRNLEPHIDIKDIDHEEKENMNEKMGKLRGLLNKLPNKKREET